MYLVKPFSTQLDFETGVIGGAKVLMQRRLSSMSSMYVDRHAVSGILEQDDPLIYEVYATSLPEESGQVLYCTTIILPGKIGHEYFMTKGHFHEKRDEGEVYVGLSGKGYLLMYTEEGDAQAVPMEKGTVAYVPPYWAHRTVNTGDEPFIFFAAWPGEAGHDYASIEQHGFPQLVVEENGQAVLVTNPRFQKVE